MVEYMDAQTASIAKGGDGCCHKTRMKDSPCPIGWKCPYVKEGETPNGPVACQIPLPDLLV